MHITFCHILHVWGFLCGDILWLCVRLSMIDLHLLLRQVLAKLKLQQSK
jgi:hypothetical protein